MTTETTSLLTDAIKVILDETAKCYSDSIVSNDDQEDGVIQFSWSANGLDVKYGLKESGTFDEYLESNEDIDEDDFYNEASDYIENQLHSLIMKDLQENYSDKYEIEVDEDWQNDYETTYILTEKITDDYINIFDFDNQSPSCLSESDYNYVSGVVFYSKKEDDFKVSTNQYASLKYHNCSSRKDFISTESISEIRDILEKYNITWFNKNLAIEAGIRIDEDEE